MFQDVSSKNFFLKIFLTDRKFSSPINYMFWWWNFSISQKKIWKIFFCLECPETWSKTKKLKKFNTFSKTKISPLFLKNTCKNFKSKMLECPWKSAFLPSSAFPSVQISYSSESASTSNQCLVSQSYHGQILQGWRGSIRKVFFCSSSKEKLFFAASQSMQDWTKIALTNKD